MDEKIIKEIQQEAKIYSEFVMNITGFNRPIIQTALSRMIVLLLAISLQNISMLSFIFTLILAYLVPFLILINKKIFGLIYIPTLFFLLSLSKIPIKRNNYNNHYVLIVRYFSIIIETSYHFICIAFCYNFLFKNLLKFSINMNIQDVLFYLIALLTPIILIFFDWGGKRININIKS